VASVRASLVKSGPGSLGREHQAADGSGQGVDTGTVNDATGVHMGGGLSCLLLARRGPRTEDSECRHTRAGDGGSEGRLSRGL
jgi:hypothetical protein